MSGLLWERAWASSRLTSPSAQAVAAFVWIETRLRGAGATTVPNDQAT